jgi:CubicO group peptidase (beta-lactamase class C family)
MIGATRLRRGAVVLGMGLVLTAMAVARPAAGTTAALVNDAMSDAGVVGLALVRLRDGQVVDVRGFGQAEIGGGDVGPDTAFQAASLGKVAAAYATLILIEQGKLELDQPLTDPRIDVPDGCEVPTVRAALQHVSGMSNDLTAARFQATCPADDTFRYSGQGFLALATEIERVGGRPATELIAALVFVPLGMTSTRFGPAASADGRARGHISWTAYAAGQAIGNPLGLIGLLVLSVFVLLMAVLPLWFGIRRGWRTGTGAWLLGLGTVSLLAAVGVRGHVQAEREMPADWIPASLSTTATDMGRFAAELLAPRLLSGTTAQHLLEPVVSVSDCIGWSLVMGTDRCGEQVTAWQWGSNLGFQSLLVLAPASGDGVVILTNTGGGIDAVLPGQGGYPAAKHIAAEVLGIDGRWDLRE